jgi:uncharacterized membrane protein YoaK (UPF0700 family)
MPKGSELRLAGADVKLILLAAASGSMDALSFVGLGEVFTSAMTGNAALLGLAIGRGNILGASRALTAFLGYILGVVIASSRLKHDVGPPRWSREVEHVVLFEAGFLLAFAALWFAMGGPSTTITLYTLILIAAIAMGLQSAAVTQLRVPGITTTYFTGTLTNIVGAFVGWTNGPGDRAAVQSRTRQQIMVFLTYLVSALVTGLLAQRLAVAAAFLPAVAVWLVLVELWRMQDA